MPPFRRAPQQLKTVAYLYMLEGFLCFASMVVVALNGVLFFNPGVVAILLGWGLLSLNRSLYRWAYFFAWLYFAFTMLGLLFLTFAGLASFGNRLNTQWWDPLLVLTFIGLFLIVSLKFWQIDVLDSPPVRRAFGLPDRN